MSHAHPRRDGQRRAAAALLIGAIFGVGLAIGGMTDARVVLGFLDVAAFPSGSWDPRLLFVMAGGLAFSVVGVIVARRRGHPLLGGRLHLPSAQSLDARLIGGAALFGIGWGVAGYCPGPGLAALVLNPGEALWFVPAMLVGSWLAWR